MSDILYFLAVIAVYIACCTEPATMKIMVYRGEPLMGEAMIYSAVDKNGTVFSHDKCYDNIETWCDGMIEAVGAPLYLMTDSYYGNNENVTRIASCQQKMAAVSGW